MSLRSDERKKNGICVRCPAMAIAGQTRCVTCALKHKEYSNKSLEKAIARGLCRNCCRVPKTDDSTMCEACNAKNTKKEKELYRKWRSACLEAYGSMCRCCGNRNTKYLQLDHVNNDGAEHRKTIGGMYAWAFRNRFPGALQLLCANCHQAKTHYGGCSVEDHAPCVLPVLVIDPEDIYSKYPRASERRTDTTKGKVRLYHKHTGKMKFLLPGDPDIATGLYIRRRDLDKSIRDADPIRFGNGNYIVTAPDGIDLQIFGLRQFCEDNGISESAIRQALKFDRKTDNGWAIRRLVDLGPKIKCSVTGCDGIHVSRGFCSKHHARWRKTGIVIEGDVRYFAEESKGKKSVAVGGAR